jgi:hypothetical protein
MTSTMRWRKNEPTRASGSRSSIICTSCRMPGVSIRERLHNLKNLPSCWRAWRRRLGSRRVKSPEAASRPLRKSASGILASFRPSTYPRGYASGLHSLRSCWTSFLNSLLGSLKESVRTFPRFIHTDVHRGAVRSHRNTKGPADDPPGPSLCTPSYRLDASSSLSSLSTCLPCRRGCVHRHRRQALSSLLESR